MPHYLYTGDPGREYPTVGLTAEPGLVVDWEPGPPADGRWEPQNFPFFQIKDSELSWDWNTDSSNYETLRLSKEAALKGKGATP